MRATGCVRPRRGISGGPRSDAPDPRVIVPRCIDRDDGPAEVSTQEGARVMARSPRGHVLTEVRATVDPSRHEALVAGFEALLAESRRTGCCVPSSSTPTGSGGSRLSGETVKHWQPCAPAPPSPRRRSYSDRWAPTLNSRSWKSVPRWRCDGTVALGHPDAAPQKDFCVARSQ